MALRGAVHFGRRAKTTLLSLPDSPFSSSHNQFFCTFQENLSNVEVLMCQKLGTKSKSSGNRNQQHIPGYMTEKYANPYKRPKNLTPFTFSEKGKNVLKDLFSRYPPDDGEVAELTDGVYSARTRKVREKGIHVLKDLFSRYPPDDGEVAELTDGVYSARTRKVQEKRDDIFRKPSMRKSDIIKKVKSFSARMKKSHNLRQIFEVRSKLPIASFKDTITSTIESHQVVLISGGTGCGKTTQVPQYLLDYMWSKGETCKIVCTQPRRIATTSVSKRISIERGEDVGDTVGYKIRSESNGGRHSSIVFCTNGILLKVLVNRGEDRSNNTTLDELSDITHIIVDEIHERDHFSDLMLAILRDVLPLYPHLHLILMSATLDAERFSEYFGGCPIIRVPGFTYPVKSFYLEDVLSIVKSTTNNHLDNVIENVSYKNAILTEEYRSTIDEAINLALLNDEFDPLLELISSKGGSVVLNYQHSSTGVTPLMVFAGKGRVHDIRRLLFFVLDCKIQDNDGRSAFDWAEQENHKEASEIIKEHMEKAFTTSSEKKVLSEKYLPNVEPERIDYVLIEQLLRKICTDSKDGSVLVFLPGWDDINRTREQLNNSSFFKDSSKFVVICLHSKVPSVEQKKVFERPPSGCRKIILSTNIAESSITIDDVVFVIDSGQMKEKNYDPISNVSSLHSSWISKASVKQRKGRAGRCQAGICYHLYSEFQFTSMPDYQVPEIKRIHMEALCLQVKLLDPYCKIEDFLGKTLDPPTVETIRNAITVLQDIGALSLDEKLTELGEKIGSLPVNPLMGKMLLISILFNCLDPALTLACASDCKDPFTLPMSQRERETATAAKAKLASLYGGHGDQLAVIAAFDCWRSAKQNGQAERFCSEYFVSSSTMNMLSKMRKQLQSELVCIGFIPKDLSHCSLNSRDGGILHAVLVTGLYPMAGRLHQARHPEIETSGGKNIQIHPHSINFKNFRKETLVIYDEITFGDWGLQIRNCCVVGPLPMLLLATEIVAVPVNGKADNTDNEDKTEIHNVSELVEKIMFSPDDTVKVIIDGWLPYESKALDAAQIYCLRERLSAAILFKVKYPGKVLPEILAESINSMTCILSSDGMSGISLPFGLTEIIRLYHSKRGTNQNSDSFLQSLVFQNTSSHYQRGKSQKRKAMKN